MRAVASLVAAVACTAAAPRPPLRMNDVQSIGSHSFKARIPDAVLAAIRARAPQEAEALDYDHLPLTAQLDRGGHDDRVRPRGWHRGGSLRRTRCGGTHRRCAMRYAGQAGRR